MKIEHYAGPYFSNRAKRHMLFRLIRSTSPFNPTSWRSLMQMRRTLEVAYLGPRND